MGLAAEFCNRRTRVNNAPRSRQRTRRIDRLAGRNTTPDTSMVQKMAGNKGVSESGGRGRSCGRRRLAGREVFTLKKRPLASTAPAELIYLQRDKASSPPLESSLSIGGVSNYPTNKITRSSASREPGRVEMVRRIISRRRGDHTQLTLATEGPRVPFFFCALRAAPAPGHSQQLPTSSTRPPSGKTNVYTQRPIPQQRHNVAALRGHDIAGAPLCTANYGVCVTVPASVASAPADGRLSKWKHPKPSKSHGRQGSTMCKGTARL
jgi:hypothetical protein